MLAWRRRGLPFFDPLSDLPRLSFDIDEVMEHDGELVSADPCHRIRGSAYDGAEPAGERNEHGVSHRVAVLVIDPFEAIDV